MLVVVMMGPAGSGKGTQSKFISQQYNIPEISTGDLLRKKVEAGDERGKKIDDFISKGIIVPDDMMLEILYDRLKEDDCKNGFILDGFPRTIEQAIELEKFLEKLNTKISGVLVFDIPKDVVFKRTSGRFKCMKCGSVYNRFYGNTKVDGVCDNCGSKEFYTRSDDQNLDAIQKRLDIYEEMSRPIIDFYEKKDLTFFVNALKSIEEISQDIKDILTNINK